jgi:hypothetical protein
MKIKVSGSSTKRIVRRSGNDRPSLSKDAPDIFESEEFPTETKDDTFRPPKNIIDSLATSIAADLRLLADNFWYDLPARITNVSFQEDQLVLRMALPFRNPQPSNEPGDWLARQKDIDHINLGFLGFLKEQPLIGRRLANLFYSEFHRFLLRETKRFRLGDAVRTKIEGLGERRLAGRPKLPIPDRARDAVKREVRAIYGAVLEIQDKIKCWKKEAGNITDNQIRDRLKAEYDREHYPWSRYAFQVTRILPAKRAYGSYKKQENHQLTRPGFDQPERWSASDVAALWAQTWFYREYGELYDLREIRKLLKPTKGD